MRKLCGILSFEHYPQSVIPKNNFQVSKKMLKNNFCHMYMYLRVALLYTAKTRLEKTCSFMNYTLSIFRRDFLYKKHKTQEKKEVFNLHYFSVFGVCLYQVPI